MNILKEVSRALVNLIYPSLCINCTSPCLPDSPLFCTSCLEIINLIDPSERCPKCFSSNFNAENKNCDECSPEQYVLDGVASAFDFEGPPSALVRKLKYGNAPYLAKGGAAFLAGQLLRMEWRFPDIIVPVPISFTHWLSRGYNQSNLLAVELGKIINRPVSEVLERSSGDYSQAGLRREQRAAFDGATIKLKERSNIQDTCILLIDDVMTTGSTLRKCSEALRAGFPEKIYALTLCKTI